MDTRGSTPTERLLKHGVLLLALAGTLFPVVFVFKLAFSGTQQLDVGLVPWPEQVSLANFEGFVSRELPDGTDLFPRQLLNSAIVSVATTLLGMFPGTLMLIPIYVILQQLNLLNNLLGLVLVYSTTAIPFCVWTLKGYFDTIPVDLEESARIDGASPIVIFYRIILPLARPAIAVTALFSFMTGWNEFILAATFMDRETAYTMPVALQRYVGQYGGDWGFFAAGAVIVSVPVVLLFYVLQRNLVSGLTAGGVKG
jgi:arabinogalactan oligomer/maltooligosaccharide transport system permease protein